MHKLTGIIIILLGGFIPIEHRVLSSELTYQHTNPSFGGNPYNAQWLMNEAQVQNEYEEKKDISLSKRDPLEDFKESLNRQILSQLARKVTGTAFGDTTGNNQLVEGSYLIGDYQIDIKPNISVINITITDKATGNTTVIEVPYYSY